MSDTAALTTLTAQYCHRFDDGDLEALLDLFDEDATVEFAGQSPTGREQLSTFVAAIAARTKGGRHLCVNHEFAVEGQTARGISDFMLAYVDDRPTVIGRYHDTYRKTDGRWRFASRRIIPAG
jgi:uncharacterized protein (TIGR02246 family)